MGIYSEIDIEVQEALSDLYKMEVVKKIVMGMARSPKKFNSEIKTRVIECQNRVIDAVQKDQGENFDMRTHLLVAIAIFFDKNEEEGLSLYNEETEEFFVNSIKEHLYGQRIA